MEKSQKRLLVIDANAVVHRAYHALPKLTTKKGEPVNAIYGFLLFLMKAVKDFQPDFIVAAFDFPAKNFRHEKYKEYKANREKAPDDLYEQIPKVKDLLSDFGIMVLEKEGFEADDIIGTVSSAAQKDGGIETIIASGDADVLQLVGSGVKAYILRKGIKDSVLYDEEKVEEKYGGLAPEKLVYYKSLRGDPSDNIPGVFGIGEKTAIELIKKFGSTENLYKEIEGGADVKESVREKLLKNKKNALVSEELAKIDKEVPIKFNLADSKWGNYDKQKVMEDFENYEFKTLTGRLGEINMGENEGKETKKKNNSRKAGENNLSLF